MLRLYVPFLSFQLIISRIMRCFQFIKLETTSLTNNNDDIVWIISVCDSIFRKLIVHAAKFTDSEDCHSNEGYRLRDQCEAMHRTCHWWTRCVFRYFFEQCLLFQTSSFYCRKVFHSLPKTWNGLFSFHILPKEQLISFMSGVYSLQIKLKRNQQLRSKSCSMCQNIGGQNSSCLREYLANSNSRFKCT